MILRVARFTLKDGVEPEFMKHTRRLVGDMIEGADGLVDVRVARRMEGGQAVVLVRTRWRDFESVRRFYGPNIDRPRLWDPDGAWVTHATIEHMEDELDMARTAEAS